ncbi:methyltransferase type 12 [Flexivirga endophytica]|uniref:Methyltransferase type 12 n=1 Tax=Flexivirga endophytica TaxID=1849103 RepID=A0A916T6S9_9MICO|nr:methyltransferase domain-containing protein [Flexivirga endophytica]GGB32393.1 methyltransferase type 12 [Flexivirga endophytica]GHB53274.1 methyltransferase type 12 [Flexivirga endophytica]
MSQTSSADDHAQDLAAESLAGGSPTAWFEELYDAAGRGEAEVPWDRGAPHPLLSEWFAQHPEEATGHGRTAIVPGVGPGHDSELLASLGFRTTAFDVAPTAIDQVLAAHLDSPVDYRVADLFELPAAWRGAFDLVVESMTVQSMPRDVREAATLAVRSLAAPGGVLLVIGGVLPADHDLAEGPPWRLTRQEIEAFGADGLALQGIDVDREGNRYRAEFRRARR